MKNSRDVIRENIGWSARGVKHFHRGVYHG